MRVWIELRWPIGPFDAKCAADAEDDCNVFTSPNMNWVPEFPRISGQEIVTREDGLWGPQEYTRWPQVYNNRCIHHACIPTEQSPYAPGYQVYEGLGFDPWDQSKGCGVADFGQLRSPVMTELAEMAVRVLAGYDKAEAAARKRNEKAFYSDAGVDRRLGGTLGILLRNAVDRLMALPCTKQHAMVTARMAHRLMLELAGLTVYYEVVSVRFSSNHTTPAPLLNVLGAFVRNDAAAQLFHRLGLPCWHIRPWSTHIKIHKIVRPRRWDSILSHVPASPRIPKSWYDPDGTHQDPAGWTHSSVIFVSNMLASSALPRLQVAQPPAHKSSKRGTRSQGRKSGTKASNSGPHPATELQLPPPDLVRVSPNWVAALSQASPLLFPPPVASEYYFPPPFVILNSKTKQSRYIHNYARVRQFCQARLVDSSINGTPLRVADWRHVLYGDYRLDEPSDAIRGSIARASEGDTLSQAQTHSYLYERTQAVRRLFAKGGGLTSYNESDVSLYRGFEVNLDLAKNPGHLLALMIWELYETNWRCELRALDTRLAGRSDDAFRHWEREQRIAQVWLSKEYESGFSVVDVSTPSFCWTPAGEDGWEKRRGNLQALLSVMCSWPNVPETVRSNASTIGGCDDVELFKSVDACALKYYVNTFATQFHRLPCPPVLLLQHPRVAQTAHPV
ncbi:uncharacterized protein C8Q71DRAFT_700623 [Rhodofomes roseus]|uniref:Uncharacterized protein n=1 Tax=Rhodofomes roseus TaxID=34475 RepID=A0ABQ8KVE8_9APHY|nr:uncharacterized protein C8Q71DRAFT_700623 [Rhodofomes roseus]KAH9842051.1 hypothetical protein C8Q71DRAFT_700623 [Rhodofomes roseus]